MMRRALFILLSLFVLLAVAGGGAGGAWAQGAGQQAKIAVTARAGYGDSGEYLIGDWLPVRVTLDNPAGGTSMHVRVQVESKGSDDAITAGLYARDLDLPASSHKEVTLYAYSGTFTRHFTVAVMDGSNVVASVGAAADPYEPLSNLIVGVISSDSSLMNVLKGEQVGHIVNSLQPGGYSGSVQYLSTSGSGSSAIVSSGVVGGGSLYAQNGGASSLATIAHMKLDDIPPLSEALDSLGVLILDDVDTGSLSADQRSALEAWVSRGGMLIAELRPGGADVTAGIANLLPVTVSGSRTVVSLDSLGDLVGATSPPPGQATVGSATLRPETAAASRLLAQQDGLPIAVERGLGLGEVVYLGVSPGAPPLKAWDGTLPLIKRVLADHALQLSYGDFLRFSPSRGYYSGSLFDTYGGMFALPALDLPNPLLIGFFLLLYIIVVGPVNFIILRRIRRAELAWLTVPVLVVLFSVVAYLVAFQSKGGDVVAIRANVVSTYPDVEQATFAQHFGLFSPVRSTYRFRLPADSAVTELNSYGYYQPGSDTPSPVLGGNPTTIDNVNIDTWSLKAYVAEHTGKAESPVETNLNLSNNVIVGTIKNRSTSPLQDVALVRGDAVRYVGYLAPGQQLDVRLDVSSGRFDNSSPIKLIPPPPGVRPPQSGLTFQYTNGQGSSAEQRTYDRKIELLSAGLYPLVADEPPADMSVIVLAWGPSVPTNFDVPDHSTSTEELNLWTFVVPVGSAGNEQAVLSAGSVPYRVYAPGNNPSIIVWNGSGTLSPTPGAVPSAVPTLPPGARIVPPTISAGGSTPSPLSIHISPYADVQYRLPAGTKPDKLTLTYSIGQGTATGDIAMLAYNIKSGKWDSIGSLSKSGTLSIPSPTLYTGPAGDVTIRLQPKGDAILSDVTLNLALNGQ
jgi:hypothetical protein